MSADTGRWIVLALVGMGAVGGVYLYYEQTRPCATPIHYAVQSIDSRFALSHETLVSLAEDAARIWNTAAGKTLFTYDPSAALTISLVYDERQAAVLEGKHIESERAQLEELRRKIEVARVACASECGDALATQVADYNARTRRLNNAIVSYNHVADHAFRAGQFVRDASGERIEIFEFIDTMQLERVLTHEFGHALGLDHTNDPASIMYAENESGNLVPTVEDRAALERLCRSH